MIKIGTSGFRGIDGVEIDDAVVHKIGMATVNIIRKKNLRREVFIGYDFRKNSIKYAYILANLLSKNGILCHFMRGGVTSSMISFLCRVEHLDLSIMVTSSHNPYTYNGVKIFSKGGQDLDSQLEKCYNDEMSTLDSMQDVVVDARPFDADAHQDYYERKYISSLTKNVVVDKNLKIVVDTMHGSSRRLVNKLVKALGVDAKVVDSMKLKGKVFPAPIPSEENLSLHADIIRNEGCDFTFATDGDGDRMAFVFDDLSYHDASDVAPLLYYYLIHDKHKSGALVCNYSFSQLGKMTAESVGAKFVESKIGFKNIGEVMLRENALMGCENSSLAYSPHTPYKDGLVALVLMCEMVSCYKQKISEIMQNFKKKMQFFMNYCEISYNFEEKFEKKEKFNASDDSVLGYINMPKFTPKIDGEELQNLGMLDGYKYFFSTSTVLIRQSGTEKKIRFVVESARNAQKLAESIKSQFEHFVQNYISFV